MTERLDLTQGEITPTLIKLAKPIMATSFIQMLYNLTDQMWLGRYHTDALAGAGVSGYIMWVGMALALIASVGTSVNMAHAVGAKNFRRANDFINAGIQLTLLIAIVFSSLVILNAESLIRFFNLDGTDAFQHGLSYLRLVAAGFVFHFYNVVFAAIYNAAGKSGVPFRITSVGLVINMIADPLLIFGFDMGAFGAAVATVSAQLIVFLLFLFRLRKEESWLREMHLFSVPKGEEFVQIIKTGVPSGMQSAFFAGVSIYLLRMISDWGKTPIAVQSVGAQIESISWMTADGFSTAITAFVAQNYGAGNAERLKRGYHAGLRILMTIGITAMVVFLFFGRAIYSVFTPNDPTAIDYGTSYLFIFAFCQAFMTLEGASMGAFNGMGKTYVPAANGILFNGLRIPLSWLFLGVGMDFKGVWWAMSIGAILKGLVLFLLLTVGFRRGIHRRTENDGR